MKPSRTTQGSCQRVVATRPPRVNGVLGCSCNSDKQMDSQTHPGEVHACVVPSDPAVPAVACSRSPCVACPRRGFQTRSSMDLGQSDKCCLSINQLTSAKCTISLASALALQNRSPSQTKQAEPRQCGRHDTVHALDTVVFICEHVSGRGKEGNGQAF